MKSGKVISIHDARIKTVAVGIKAMTISDRQVTLAVFRQLLEEALIDHSAGRFNGVPWGFVNVHDKDCPSFPHRHYVWQKADELWRCTERTEPIVGMHHSKAIDAWVLAEIEATLEKIPNGGYCQQLNGRFVDQSLRGYLRRITDGRSLKEDPRFPFQVSGFAVGDNYYELAARWESGDIVCVTDHQRICLPPVPECYRAKSVDRGYLKQIADSSIEMEMLRRDRFKQMLQELESMPQLFVAV